MKKSSNSVYEVQYHIIWCPKFRYKVLDSYETIVKEILTNICKKYKYEIIAMEVMPDHIHLFVSTPHTVAPCDIVRTLKSVSAIELFKKYPSLKRFYAKCGQLWSDSYYIGTVGNTNKDTIKQYVENQKKACKN